MARHVLGWQRLVPYLLAVACVIGAATLRWALDPFLDTRYGISIFFLAIVAAAFLGGTRPALLAMALSWLIGVFIFVEPRFQFFTIPTADVIGSFLFFIVGAAIALLAGRLRLLTRQAQQEATERAAQLARTAQRLDVADRMALVGMLTAGVGHDISNLLFPMNVRLQSVEQQLQQAGVTSEDMETLYAASRYLSSLARGLSYLVNDPHTALSGSTDLANWAETVRPLLRTALPRNVSVTSSIRGDLPRANIAPHALTQAVFNAVHNAGKAMEGRPGRVELSAAVCEDKQRICLRVRDDGPGIAPEVLGRLDEPPARDSQRRVGMGLPIIRSIIERSNGSLTIKTGPGQGTELCMELPIDTQPATTPDHDAATTRAA